MKTILRAPLTASVLILLLVFALLTVLLPKADFSEMENRALAVPDLRADDRDRQIERWLADHFPFRDTLIRVQSTLSAAAGQRLQDGVLIGRGGRLFEEPPAGLTPAAENSIGILNDLARRTGLPFTMMLVPTSAQYVQGLPPLYGNADQRAVLRQIGDRIRFEWVEIPFDASDDPDTLWYRTDHHLTAAGARLCYETLCSLWGLEPRSGRAFTSDGFLGSYWSKTPLFGIRPDVFGCELPENVRLTVDGTARESLLDPDALRGRNRYAALIAGTYGHAVLENDTAAGRLMIVCDSYANALAPLLSEHFGRIDLIDPRYCPDPLPRLLEQTQSDRVLIFMGLNTFSVSRATAMLAE